MNKLTILCLLMLLACSQNIEDEIQYQVVKLKKNVPVSENSQDSICYHIEFSLPVLGSGASQEILEEVNFQLNRYFFEGEVSTISNDPKKNFVKMLSTISESYQKEALEFKNEFPDLDDMLNYKLIKSGKVVYNRNGIISIACETYSYTGGAHGMNYIEYLHFDMNTGRPFNLDELFDKTGKQKLTGLVSARCEAMKRDKDCQIFAESAIESIENFYFDEEHFYFVYNPYEIGPFSAGYITIEIPLAEIKPLLKNDIHPGFIQ